MPVIVVTLNLRGLVSNEVAQNCMRAKLFSIAIAILDTFLIIMELCRYIHISKPDII